LLIAVFLLVPLVFIVAYIMTTPAQDGGASDVPDGNEMFVPPPAEPDGVLPADEPPAEPEEEPVIEIIGVAYLTFDDGPSRTVTPGILDILADEGVTATFFAMPYTGADDIFQRIINEGHEIGNHSYSHDYPKIYQGSVSTFREDVLRARRFFEENYGYSSTSFRFPGGSHDQNASVRNPRIDAIRELGYRYFDWDIDTNDWRQGISADDVIGEVLNNTNGKEHIIILMHDSYGTAMEALPGIIEGLRELGYEFDILKNHPG